MIERTGAGRTPTSRHKVRNGSARWASYGWAALAIVAANGLVLLLQAWHGTRPDLLLFVVPIILAAHFGGPGAGLFATLLAAASSIYLLLPGRERFFEEPVDIAQWSILFVTGALISVLAARHSVRYARRRQRDLAIKETTLQQERLRALGQMASGIAHDVNNAISPVTLYLETLLDEERALSAEGRRSLETIQRAIDDVAHTIARLREFSREREPQATLLPVDLNELTRQVIRLTQARWSDMAQERGVVIDLQTDLAAQLPPILGVESELRDALVNLIFNAVDAMPEGGPLTLRTCATRVAASVGQPLERFVQLEVADAGVGMDEDTRQRCVEPFFTTKGERGTGLGLAMVYGTMQRHGSDIEIESAPGEGTTMRFTFPVPSAHAVEIAAPAPNTVPPLRILVIDDDPLVGAAVRDTLVRDGHTVVLVGGGREGIDAFLLAQSRREAFQVVLSDLGMPYVDGREVCRRVKDSAPGTIVILMTGWGQRMVLDVDLPPNVDCVLGKPPRRRDLRAALASRPEPGADDGAAPVAAGPLLP